MVLSARFAYVLLLAFVFAIPWEESIVLPGIGSVARLIGIGAFLFAVIALFERGRLRLRRFSVTMVVLLLYFSWQLLSAFWSIEPETTLSSATTLFQLLIMLWLVWQLCPQPARQRGLAQAYVLGAAVTVVNILWIFFVQPDAIRIDGRIASAGANQNDVASAMALALPFAWMLLLHHRRGFRFWFNLLFMVAALVAIVLTGSRGGTVTAAVAMLAVPLTYFQLRPRTQWLLVGLLVTVGVLALVVPNRVIDRATPNFIRLSSIPEDLSEGNLTGRLVIWQAGYQRLQERPLLGFGAATFREVVRPVLGTGPAPHNTFLSIAVGSGLVGLALFMVLILTLAAPLIGPVRRGSSVPLVLFLAMLISILPLGWETHKVPWFCFAFLNAVSGVAVVTASSRGAASLQAAPAARS